MKLSIIIVNYNVEHFLEQCLLSVRKAVQGIEAEVIVVDNASVDGSLKMVRSKFPEVRLIPNKDNKGFSKANNQGIQESTGEFVLLLNPDTIVEEDTFKTCIAFMDEHPDAGGLGVRMLDGKGRFLPESKRGLPTPRVAFYKIFGLSALFPRSARFNQYHLGHLDEFSSHEVDVLSGAYMFMRRRALEKVGLLDEDYFMYGEDIDLSYRLIKGGYKNYYTPDTRIIHYKGESTKKTSVNYVMVFYNAMRIFAKKHFSNQHAKSFSKLIELAIYARALLSVLKRFLQKILHPLIDWAAVLAGLLALSHIYAGQTGIVFQDSMLEIGLPIYSFVWIITAFLSSAYEYPLKDRRKIQGILMGTGMILILYSLLPEEYRFSRAIILFGTLLAILIMLFSNLLWRKFSREAQIKEEGERRYAIIGGEGELNRITTMMEEMGIQRESIYEITHDGDNTSTDRIKATADIHSIDEMIFCAKDLSAERIIDLMSSLDGSKLDYKIAPSESMFIIGSNSKDDKGDLLAFEMNSISKPVNKRNKRILDFATALIALALSPFLMWFQPKPFHLITNGLKVISGSKTWVGYHPVEASMQHLPSLRPAVLSPDSASNLNTEQKKKSNLLYAKDFRASHDLDILLRNWKYLGQ